MLHSTLPLALLALSTPLAAALDPAIAQDLDGVEVAQVTIRERMIIRVPRMPVRTRTPIGARVSLPPVEQRWKEKRGPKCIPAQAMAGALVRGPDTIDLIMAGGKRLRARLDDDCKPLDFYSGFYLRPSADGQVCIGRDSVQARSGAMCMITRFRRLEPKN
ncbi:hypothetical protein ASE75_01560 [Sphingomonas sp. Leaf17]|uniref:hypothetical protein n=1 Tax=Sphingomonas sp. Leaf17 TaxID=1735683 RepID=UPI0006F567E4|nr:hypothetical protein [Sphingomonas sp. Leaf17]KQM67645.1 hypothetical protein ASE75_01560 [Sphingomonas sp. Leaf17]